MRLDIDGAIALEGVCPVEDAEPLQRLLLRHREAVVDWRACDAAHTAVFQVLLVAKPSIKGPARATFLQDFILPALARHESLTATEETLPLGDGGR